MSHVTSVSMQIRDLNALKQACARMGAIFVQDQKTYAWYGRSVGDFPIPQGMTEADLGKCNHAIRVPGVRYEIGVVKQKDGTYSLAYDFYGTGGGHDGQKLKEKFGDGLGKLKQAYAVAAAKLKAKAMGWMCHETTLPNGTIKLAFTGV